MANRTKFAGWYRALDYYYGGPNPNNSPASPEIITAPSATGAGSVTLTSGPIVLSDGTVANVLATTAPVLVGSGSNQETVTPSAVQNASSQIPGVAGFTATFANLHGQGDPVASATAGLQEAINDAATNGGGTVVVDAAWYTSGGTAAILAAATLPASGKVSILDNSGANGSGIVSQKFVLTNTQTKALNSAPTSLIAAPGAGNMIDVIDAVFENVFLTAAFANGGVIQLSYGTGTTIPASATIAATFLTSPTASQVVKVAGALASNLVSAIANTAIYVACATADFITGAGHLVITINYRVVTGL
jgi:hypothetical protein